MPYEVIRILRVAKGHGLVVGQANFDNDALSEAEALLEDGEAPVAVLRAITDPAVFPKRAVGAIWHRRHRWTDCLDDGAEQEPFADDLDGTSGSVHFTVQGSSLTDPEMLAQMAPVMDEGCNLPERLVRALEAAGDGGTGDSRCAEDGLSALSAYVYVTWKDGAEFRVSLPVGPANAVIVLREALEEWRVDHGCPAGGR